MSIFVTIPPFFRISLLFAMKTICFNIICFNIKSLFFRNIFLVDMGGQIEQFGRHKNRPGE